MRTGDRHPRFNIRSRYRGSSLCCSVRGPYPCSSDRPLMLGDAHASPGADRRQMEQVLSWVGMTGSWLARDATALSGGEAQRVCLARTLITQPDVLLLDEPTSALDESAVGVVERAVLELAQKGIAVLWVTHDPEQVQRIADRVLRIEAGRCVGLHPVARPPDSEGV